MSQTPPPSDERSDVSQAPGVVRSILIRVLRATISVLEGWIDRLEATESAATTRSPLSSPLLWVGALVVAIGVGVVAVPLLLPSTEPTPPEVVLKPLPVEPQPPVRESPTPTPIELPPLPPSETESEPELDVREPETLKPSAESELPSELSSPDFARPVELAPPSLTPEQRLVAAVQAQIVQVAQPYEDNEFVRSVSADFEADRLRVSLKSQWYDLDPIQQDRLANELWGKAKSLDFTHVEITDEGGTLLARNPIVGDRAIVLQRSSTSLNL
ncbi:MAG: hypothetical protein J7641_22185 [Cyanobacteria bacterium SID2]|nr:hypothetical protein [Cyanobacteria bacterium SID2]MBP0004509.1 hypothetical protein [Cyanobacteria bacterium SBC]